MAEKPSDCWALPLSRSCHIRQHAFGSETEWWSAHGIDPFKLSMQYFEEYAGQADVKALWKERKQARRLENPKPKRKAKIPSRPFPKKAKK